ncbi:hypothetical protein ACD578_29270 (plasmid) [Microvirga sp. RSM25]|uniref:hypothetical protein n=1 Tax=Microvirga sp. RSM25 TaxID=3273802 RepID=UPI00384EE4AC
MEAAPQDLFCHQALVDLSGYSMNELFGQDPHFMNGEGTDPQAIRRYEGAIVQRRTTRHWDASGLIH